MHSHAVALAALGYMGADLFEAHPEDWQNRIKGISGIDWSRSNLAQWEGRALVLGKISKSKNNVILTSNVLKKAVGLSLQSAELELEERFNNV